MPQEKKQLAKRIALFTNSYDKSWQLLSREIDGEFTPGSFMSGSSKVDKIHRVWNIRMTIAPRTGLYGPSPNIQLRVPYVSNDDFQFELRTKGFWTKATQIFYKRGINSGFHDLDSKFLIKTNDKEKLVAILGSRNVQHLLINQKDCIIKIRTNLGPDYLPPKVRILEYVGMPPFKKVKEVKYLKQLFDLCAKIIDEFERVGTADLKAPPHFLY